MFHRLHDKGTAYPKNVNSRGRLKKHMNVHRAQTSGCNSDFAFLCLSFVCCFCLLAAGFSHASVPVPQDTHGWVVSFPPDLNQPCRHHGRHPNNQTQRQPMTGPNFQVSKSVAMRCDAPRGRYVGQDSNPESASHSFPSLSIGGSSKPERAPYILAINEPSRLAIDTKQRRRASWGPHLAESGSTRAQSGRLAASRLVETSPSIVCLTTHAVAPPCTSTPSRRIFSYGICSAILAQFSRLVYSRENNVLDTLR